MSPNVSISPDKLSRLIGRPDGPAVIDVRIGADVQADARLIPGSVGRPFDRVQDWGPALAGRSVVAVCQKGHKLSHGVAAWLRSFGVRAKVLDGGTQGWANGGLPMVPIAAVPARDAEGRTVWVTRARPKIDRIACPWLIRRFVDPRAVFLFVAPAEVEAVAERFGATPFDVEGVAWSHHGEFCSFDVMVRAFGLSMPALARLATVVRGADTGRLDLAPEAAGLLAACLGLSRMYPDDLEQLAAGLTLFDAFYRWSRDAADEKYGWPAAKAGA